MDLYDHLGVPRDAKPDQIKRAYRNRAARSHPDVAPGKHKEFLALVLARDVLLDEDARAHYDRTGEIPRKQPTAAPILLIRQIAVSCAAENPSANLLGAIREQLANHMAEYKSQLRQCDAATDQVEKRWHNDEMKEHIIEEFRVRRQITQNQHDAAEAALKLLKDSKYDGVDAIQFVGSGASIGGCRWITYNP